MSEEQIQYTLNKNELAPMLGVSVKTIEAWVAQGLPHYKQGNGKENLYNLEECLKWRKETGKEEKKAKTIVNVDSLNAAKVRKTEGDARLIEMKEKVYKGRLLRKSYVQREMLKAVGFFKTALVNLPNEVDLDDESRKKVAFRLNGILEVMAKDLERVAKKVAKRQREEFRRGLDNGNADSVQERS